MRTVIDEETAPDRTALYGTARSTGGQVNGPMATTIVAAGAIAALYFGRVILEPFALAVLLSLMLAPAVRVLRPYLGRAGSVMAAVLFAFVVIFGFAAAIGDELVTLAQNLPQYEQNIAAKIRSLNNMPGGGTIGRVTRVFHDLNQELAAASSGGPPSSPPGTSAGQGPPIPVEIHSTQAAPLLMLRDMAGPLLTPLLSVGLVALFVIMVLLKREDLRNRFLLLAGAGDLDRTTAAMNEAAERVSRYLLMQFAVGIAYGIPVAIGLALIGIPNAPLWGIVGVLMRFVPYLGGALTAIIPVVLAIAVDPGWSLLLWTVLMFIAIEFVIGNLAEPWIYGRSTGLSSVAIVAATVFWTWLWGPVAVLLATPLTVCLVVLGRHVPQLRFLEVMLGNEPVLLAEESFYQRLLARDPEEATEQAEAFARTNSIEAFFDDVAMPALALAQADSDRGALAGDRRAIIAEGLAAVLDNLAEDGLVEGDDDENVQASPDPIVCLAGRNELDLAGAWLLQHMARRRGYKVTVFSPDALATFNLDRLPLRTASVVCLSLVSTRSTARARYLVRRIRRRSRRSRLLVGLWGQAGTEPVADDSVTVAAADTIVTTLAQAIAEIEAVLPQPAGKVVPTAKPEPVPSVA